MILAEFVHREPQRDAVIALLALPDPPELIGKRGHRYRFRSPARARDVMVHELLLRWLTRKLVEREDGRCC